MTAGWEPCLPGPVCCGGSSEICSALLARCGRPACARSSGRSAPARWEPTPSFRPSSWERRAIGVHQAWPSRASPKARSGAAGVFPNPQASSSACSLTAAWRANRGDQLYYREYMPAQPRALFVYHHGYGAHCALMHRGVPHAGCHQRCSLLTQLPGVRSTRAHAPRHVLSWQQNS